MNQVVIDEYAAIDAEEWPAVETRIRESIADKVRRSKMATGITQQNLKALAERETEHLEAILSLRASSESEGK